MSAQANITIYDGAATPVQHTFVPVSVVKEPKSGELVASWREQVSSVPTIAQPTLETRQKRLSSGVYQVVTTVAIPVMESISGQNAAGYTAAPKVAYINTIKLIGYFHERSTLAERKLARQLLLNLAGSVGTSVAPVSSGFIPELVDQLVTAS